MLRLLGMLCLIPSLPVIGASLTQQVFASSEFGVAGGIQKFNQPGSRLVSVLLSFDYSGISYLSLRNFSDEEARGTVSHSLTMSGGIQNFHGTDTVTWEDSVWLDPYSSEEVGYFHTFSWTRLLTAANDLQVFAGKGTLMPRIFLSDSQNYWPDDDNYAFVWANGVENDGSMRGTVTMNFVAVPEPSALALIGAGLALLAFLGLRRSSR